MSTDSKTDDTANRSNYMRSYYQRNKERIKAQRKQRYTHDDAYRNKLNEQRRIRRRREQEPEQYQSAGVDLQEEKETVKEMQYTITMRVLDPNDSSRSCVCNFHTLKSTASALNVDLRSLQTWLQKDSLPQPRYRSDRNWRLYTQFEVDLMRRIFIKHRKRARANNYKFRLTQEVQTEIKTKMDLLIAGVPAKEFGDTHE